MKRRIKESRRAHCAKELEDTEGDARGRWRVIKELLHSDERPAACDSDESQSTCDSFAAFFADKLAKIAMKIHAFISSGT